MCRAEYPKLFENPCLWHATFLPPRSLFGFTNQIEREPEVAHYQSHASALMQVFNARRPAVLFCNAVACSFEAVEGFAGQAANTIRFGEASERGGEDWLAESTSSQCQTP